MLSPKFSCSANLYESYELFIRLPVFPGQTHIYFMLYKSHVYVEVACTLCVLNLCCVFPNAFYYFIYVSLYLFWNKILFKFQKINLGVKTHWCLLSWFTVPRASQSRIKCQISVQYELYAVNYDMHMGTTIANTKGMSQSRMRHC